MAECVTCGNYTKFNGGFCYPCYSEQTTIQEQIPVTFKIEASGLSKKNLARHGNIIKGRIAETLIQELFLSLGYSVFHYGMENTIPGIMELLKGITTSVAEDIRRMPDFVVQDPRSNSVFFIEVKFRANGSFQLKDLPKNYPFENAHIILVSKKHIKCITVEELKQGIEITPKSQNYLGNRKEFDLDKAVIIDFCAFAIKFFERV